MLTVCCLFLPDAHAQTSYHIGMENGLATNDITTIISDHKGYMWFGSFNGLHQHQGARIRVFGRVGRDSLSLSASQMHALFEDHARNIWIGTTGGLDCMNPSTGVVRHYRLQAGADSSFNLGYIYSIFEDRERYIWVSSDVALFRLSPGSAQYQAYYAGTTGNHVPATATGYHQGLGDAQGFWLSTAAGPAYYAYRTHTFHHRYNSGDPAFALDKGTYGSAASDLCRDASGRIYSIANGNTLVRYAPGSGHADTFCFRRPAGAWECCYSLAADYRGTIWIGFRHGGLLLFNPANNTFTPLRQEMSSKLIQSNYISSLCEDYQHHMWVTTDEGIDVIDYYQKGLQLFQLSDAPDFKKLLYVSGIMSYNGHGQLSIPFFNGSFFSFSYGG